MLVNLLRVTLSKMCGTHTSRTGQWEILILLVLILRPHSLRNRRRLEQYNTFEDALRLIAGAKRILVLTGGLLPFSSALE